MKPQILLLLIVLSITANGQSKKELIAQLKLKESQITELKNENQNLKIAYNDLYNNHTKQLGNIRSEVLKLASSITESERTIESIGVNSPNRDNVQTNNSSLNLTTPSSNYTPATNSTNSYSYPSSSRTIHTGPRGGRYYINSNGNKTYVKKK
jgi:hypothetical protein